MKLKYLLPLVALCTTQVQAEVNFNGFANIIGGITGGEDESLYSYDNDFSYNADSLFGLQVSSQLDDDLSFTGQLVARGYKSWDTEVEWAFLSYEASENVRFQIGKQRGAYFMYTDFVDVGFAYHWITPPRGVYDFPVGTVTGVNTIITGSLGELDSTMQILFGREQGTTYLEGSDRDSDINNLVQLAWSVNYEWLTLRASHTTAEISLDFQDINPILAGWRQTPFTAIADEIEFNQDDASFSEFGIKIEVDDLQLIAEYTEFDSGDNFIGERESFYVSAAYRVDQVTFHVTYGADEAVSDSSYLNAVPSGVDPTLDFLTASTQGALQTRFQDETYTTVGLRWDFNPSAAFKIEYTDLTDDYFSQNPSVLRVAISTFF